MSMVGDRHYLDGVRLFLFDLDGTLRRTRPTDHEALVAFAGDAGHSFEREARAEGLRWSHRYWANRSRVQADLEALGEQGYWANFARHYMAAMGAPAADLDDLVAAVGPRFSAEFKPQVYLVPGAKELLWNLRIQGFQVGLLSNRKEPLTGLAIELGIIEHFHFTLSAGQVGCWKPDPGLFRHALVMGGGVAPEQAVYVGDNYYADSIGARNAGLKSVLVDEYQVYDFAADECLLIGQLADLKDYVSQQGGNDHE